MSDLTTSTFPKARNDAMKIAARSFDPSLYKRNDSLDAGNFTGAWRADVSESVFTAGQLQHIRPGVLEVQYPDLKGMMLVPVNTSVDTGANQFTYDVFDHVGEARVTSDLSNRGPRVDVKKTSTTTNIKSITDGYGYSIQEARAAMYARVPLPAKKAVAARDVIERKLDAIIFLGDVEGGLTGLLNQSNTVTYTVPNGASGSKTWETKTADEIVADLNGIANLIVTNSLESEQPDTLLLPLTSFTLISSKRMGDGDSTTILKHFLLSNPYIKDVQCTHKAESHATAWTGKRMTAYRRDPNKLEAIIPQPFEQLPPQAVGYELLTECHARSGGVVVYFPKSIAYGDGI